MQAKTDPGPVLFSIDDYNRMIKAGVFDNQTGRIELIEGKLTAMSPASEEHDDVLTLLNTWAGASVAGRYRVASQIGLQLLRSVSMPEPDLILIDHKNGRGRPTSPNVPLVVEVGISSLDYDLTVKQALYAEDGVPEYWVIDPIAHTVTVHLKPLGQRYAKVEIFTVEHLIAPQCLPGAMLSLHWLFVE